uniref:Uncharacterized protein n=1 Tax=Rhizophora mucronata TaxID=61149 RepID=A0A2P2QY15_RHIMU
MGVNYKPQTSFYKQMQRVFLFVPNNFLFLLLYPSSEFSVAYLG